MIPKIVATAEEAPQGLSQVYATPCRLVTIIRSTTITLAIPWARASPAGSYDKMDRGSRLLPASLKTGSGGLEPDITGRLPRCLCGPELDLPTRALLPGSERRVASADGR